jgi:cytochrome c biogenesis protein CcmG/thiol:disulfide interchange protein DsbE
MRVKVSLFWLLFIIVFSSGVNPVAGKTKAHDFTLVDINGNTFSLSGCPAKVVLIDFFGTTCIPCITVIPALRSLYSEYSRAQLEIISISSEGEALLRDFAQEQNMIWIVASDPGGQISRDYDIKYIPTLFTIDSDVYIRHKHVGITEESTLRSEINSLLSETGNGDSNGNPNGDSNGDSDTGQTGLPYTLIAIIVGAVIVFLVVGIVVAGQLLGWSEPAKKRRSRKRKS